MAARSPVQRLRRDERGAMLVEMLVVMLLMGIVGTIVMGSLVSGMRTTMRGQERAFALADVQRGADRVGRELRAGTPVSLGVHSVTTDVFRNGQRQRYTFTLTAGGVLQETRATWNSATTDPATTPPNSTATRAVLTQLSYNAAVPTFRFYTSASQPVSAPAAPYPTVDQIQMSLRRVVAPGPPLRLDTQVDFRNKLGAG